MDDVGRLTWQVVMKNKSKRHVHVLRLISAVRKRYWLRIMVVYLKMHGGRTSPERESSLWSKPRCMATSTPACT